MSEGYDGGAATNNSDEEYIERVVKKVVKKLQPVVMQTTDMSDGQAMLVGLGITTVGALLLWLTSPILVIAVLLVTAIVLFVRG